MAEPLGAREAHSIPQMEVEKPPQTAETPTLLKTYRWRTAAPVGERDPERCSASPGGRHWSRLQGWKHSYSQPESESLDDGVGKGSSNLGAPKASARRSLFQRAFSAPSKMAKEPRSPEGGKGTLQKYLRSMSISFSIADSVYGSTFFVMGLLRVRLDAVFSLVYDTLGRAD